MSPQNDRTTGTPRPAFWYHQTLSARLASFGITAERLAQLRPFLTTEEEVNLQRYLNSAVFSLPQHLHDRGCLAADVASASRAADCELQRVTDWIVALHRRHVNQIVVMPERESDGQFEKTEAGVGDEDTQEDLAV